MAELILELHDYFFVATANTCVMADVKSQRERLTFKQEGEPFLLEFFIIRTLLLLIYKGGYHEHFY